MIGNNYQTMIEMHEEDERSRRETEQLDDSGDGHIDEMELREFLLDKKKHDGKCTWRGSIHRLSNTACVA